MPHLTVSFTVQGTASKGAIEFSWHEDGLVRIELKSSDNSISVQLSDLVDMLRHMELDLAVTKAAPGAYDGYNHE